MWVEKHRPKKIAEIVGNEEAKNMFVNWLKSNRWRRKAVFLFGPSGVGKSALVHAAATEFHFNVIEMNASDTRTAGSIAKIADPSTRLVPLDTFFMDTKGSLLFIDEVDGIFGREDRGGISAILNVFENKNKSRNKRRGKAEKKEQQIPVVLAANDPELRKLRPLGKICDLIRFRKVRIPQIISLLQKICVKENIDAEFAALEKIAQNSEGDVRSAVNDLQSSYTGSNKLRLKDTEDLVFRDKNQSLYHTMKGVLSDASIQEKTSLLNYTNVDYDLLMMLLHDNLPLFYKNLLNLGIAYDFLSKADVFRGRIGVENWKLLKYFFNYLIQASSVPKRSFEPFELNLFPQKISSLYWTKSRRTYLKNICSKIALKCHVSISSAKLDFIPFLKVILEKNNSSPISSWFQMDQKEVNYLLEMDQL
jgi:replication factor C large subunit